MKTTINRRELIKYMAAAVPLSSTIGLVACGADDAVSDGTSSTSGSTDGSTSTSTSSGEWASGTTDLITVDYPDTSIFSSSGNCTVSLTEETTLGPCYFQDSTGEDISTGLSGLPMQLCLQLVDSNCNPLAGYTVEVWHCDIEGVYSGDTSNSDDSSSFAGGFCTGNDRTAENSTWYRGQLTTDSDGRVNFKTHFPGWYSSRVVHIHFAVSNGSGSRQVISQFCFTDDFVEEIFSDHDLYVSAGQPDTTLASGDTVFPSYGYDEFVLNTEQNSDGTLLAYHTIQIA